MAGDYIPNANEALIVFEAVNPGQAVISGADVWQSWTEVPGSANYYKTWTHNWGGSIASRGELVAVDGTVLTQVLAYDALGDGTYFVDEAADRLYVQAPGGVDVNGRQVDVGLRSDPLRVEGNNNVVLKGLVVRHAALHEMAAIVVNSRNVIVEDVTVEWNNNGGIHFIESEQLTVKNLVANHNGRSGAASFKVVDTVYEDLETSYNNWRGALAGETGWSVAGIKILAAYNVLFRNHAAIGNEARGFWLDTDIEYVMVDGATWCDNLSVGADFEVVQGPVIVKRTTTCNNRGWGVRTGNVQNFTFNANISCNNNRNQFEVSGEPFRSVTNFVTGQYTNVPDLEDWTMHGNTFIDDTQNNGLLLRRTMGGVLADIFNTIDTDYNTWWHSQDPNSLPGESGYPDNTLSGWQNDTGKDLNSTFTNPATPPNC